MVRFNYLIDSTFALSLLFDGDTDGVGLGSFVQLPESTDVVTLGLRNGFSSLRTFLIPSQ